MWETYYHPVPLNGKTVLDIGAGCGETAAFFISHGARKVICIEPDDLSFRYLQENIVANGLNAVPIRKAFELRDLLVAHDFLKVDAEGAEALLLGYQGNLGDCAIEAHSIGYPRRNLGPLLSRKFGLRVARRFGQKNGIWLLTS